MGEDESFSLEDLNKTVVMEPEKLYAAIRAVPLVTRTWLNSSALLFHPVVADAMGVKPDKATERAF